LNQNAIKKEVGDEKIGRKDLEVDFAHNSDILDMNNMDMV
jgi:hypothetical protein